MFFCSFVQKLFHVVSERCQCQSCHFEMLQAEGEADDGDAEEDSPKEV